MSDAPITVVMSSLVPPERKTIADMIEEASTPGLDAGEALAQQVAQWEAELASRAETVASPDWKALLASADECASIADAAQKRANEIRAAGGEWSALGAGLEEDLARRARERSVECICAALLACFGLSTEGER